MRACDFVLLELLAFVAPRILQSGIFWGGNGCTTFTTCRRYSNSLWRSQSLLFHSAFYVAVEYYLCSVSFITMTEISTKRYLALRAVRKKNGGLRWTWLCADKINSLLVYVIGLHVVQFGNNWMKKIPRTAKIGRGRRLSEEFFESNYFQIGQACSPLTY